MISLIACVNKNRGLGYKNRLLYSIPEDMKFFRETTKNSVVIMGKNTFLSIGKPLPNRTNIVITRDKNFKANGIVICHNIDEAILSARGASSVPEDAPNPLINATINHSQKNQLLVSRTAVRDTSSNKIFVIGGGQIYEQTIQKADTLYLTIVDDDTKEADAFFPEYNDFKTSTLISQGESQGYKYQILKFTK